MLQRANQLLLSTALLLLTGRAVLGQSTTLDLRIIEVDAAHRTTYQNFIFARTFAEGRVLVQSLYLRLPKDKYSELSVGAGMRVVAREHANLYLIAGYGRGTGATFAEPSLLALVNAGRFTASAFVQRSLPMSRTGDTQWIVDPVEVQYSVSRRSFLGVSLYATQVPGSVWITKLGPKVGLLDGLGSTEVRVARVGPAKRHEFQLRRIVAF